MKKLLSNYQTHLAFVFALAIVLLLALCYGCVTEKKRLKICQSCTLKSERHDSTIVIETIRKDTVLIPGPVTFISTPNPCAALCDSTGKLINNIIIPVSNGSIFARNDSLIAKCEADSLRHVIDVMNKTIKQLVTIQNDVPAQCDKDHTTGFEWFQIWVGRILAALILVFIGLKWLTVK